MRFGSRATILSGGLAAVIALVSSAPARALHLETRGGIVALEPARAQLELPTRSVPVFQFAVFYDKDLEILPGPPMKLSGPVHTNGDLYLDSGSTLQLEGPVSAAGYVYRGRKNADVCMWGDVLVRDDAGQAGLPGCWIGRETLDVDALHARQAAVRAHVEPLRVPDESILEAGPGSVLWDRADLRVVLDLQDGRPRIDVVDAAGRALPQQSARLARCEAAAYSDTFFNNREGRFIDMLEIDAGKLLDCVHQRALLPGGGGLDEGSDGGLVSFLSVKGPQSGGINGYGVRVRNAARLAASDPSAPALRGWTLVSDQAIYLQGDFNAEDKRPAAVMADSLNVLSNAWNDDASTRSLWFRTAEDTTVHAALLAGTDTTGGIEGPGGQDLGRFSGGLHNYPRLHEDWSSKRLRVRGSLVSIGTPRHVDGAWVYGGYQYYAPKRDWDYDPDFDDAGRLPPLTPRFSQLRLQLWFPSSAQHRDDHADLPDNAD